VTYEMSTRECAIMAVRDERAAQDEKYGGVEHDDTHTPNDWIVLVARYATKAAAYPACDGEFTKESRVNFRKNMVRAAALAVAAIEYVDRNTTEAS